MESQDIYSRLCWNFNRLHPHVSETTKFETLGFPYTYWGTEKLLPLDKQRKGNLSSVLLFSIPNSRYGFHHQIFS
jgi:hypothetical protein